jgi:hypothetical protein
MTTDELRAAMPLTAATVDALREHFPDFKVTYALEGRKRYGKPGPEGVRASDSFRAKRSK